MSSLDARANSTKVRESKRDKIQSFDNFVKSIGTKVETNFLVNHKDNQISLFMTDDLGSKVVLYLLFRKVDSPFGYFQLVRAEKNEIEVPKSKFNLQKNSLLYKWSQVSNILSVISNYEPSPSNRLRKFISECNGISELADSLIFQFLLEQLQLMLYSAHGQRYSKHVLILAVELICISPAAYRFVRNSNTLILPNKMLIRELRILGPRHPKFQKL